MARYAVDVIQATNLNNEDAQSRLDDKQAYAWRFLAEGDSWFTIGAIPSSSYLYELNLSRPSVLLNLGYPGDTLSNMAQMTGNKEFARRLAHPNWASDWDAILLSAGGNDLVNKVDNLVVQSPAADTPVKDCIDPEELARFRTRIRQGMEEIVALRDAPGSVNAGKPIIAHTYDYPTARPAPGNFLFVPVTQPWLMPNFVERNVPEALWPALARHLLDLLGDVLLELERELPAFHVVDTRGTLDPAAPGARGNSGDWLNEIHPNAAGYRKLAARLSAAIEQVLT
ncbi:hypothetical protein GRF61_14530 [Azoarcus sp. TTM-91]|uniref:SGNH/GDSL hydrolase family protein n=1 Tax=Azoarcus sp. TTM-91 TaxID=2691581 RepID=UPI00145E3F11|nr:SGNH/GDSL hydrolase family protein [Azoarcus sp. TTM-91]NMG35663.1 hypothetical protein [Azoarcus sp. TTM-91]